MGSGRTGGACRNVRRCACVVGVAAIGGLVAARLASLAWT